MQLAANKSNKKKNWQGMRRKCRAVLKKWVLATAVFGVHRSECSNEKLSESTKIDDLDTHKLPAAAV